VFGASHKARLCRLDVDVSEISEQTFEIGTKNLKDCDRVEKSAESYSAFRVRTIDTVS